ncbi:hypothetical protein GFS24_05910 [Chitinophaga sp. SYP-B3965]|uniref:hypothetical protein n=1 Tax=Chitinophaga sp. SYP-B3965 TaxID=2663120 RepID=UPI0012996E21|nr:hypothetical protein [Chitinophaga sp. SYP-B3965]MRG44638.1 hypothetical protein [Chitinophaga sp. SYP-B3965]
MQEIQSSIFEEDFKALRRKDLLPWWIKVFNWLFMLMGGSAVILLITGLAGMRASLVIYGLSSNGDPLTPTGLLLIGIMMFKGIAAYGLWAEKNWGVNVAMADAFIGIVICVYTMIALPGNNGFFTFRIELIALFFFLRKLLKIRNEWDSRVGA